MLPGTSPDLKVHDYYEDENRFGASDMIFVGIAMDDAYSEASLKYLKSVEDEITAIGRDLPARMPPASSA